MPSADDDIENLLKSDNQIIKKKSISGKILIGVTGGIGIGISLVCFPFVAPAFRKYCLPYVPATTTQVNNIFSALTKTNGKLIDIGSGDGRIVVAAAKKGFQAHGVELNPWLVMFSRFQAVKNGVFRKALFFQQDLWKFNLSSYDYIVIFGVEQMMKKLEEKFLNEAASNTTIIACRFPLPNLEPIQTIDNGINTVWVYKISKNDNSIV